MLRGNWLACLATLGLPAALSAQTPRPATFDPAAVGTYSDSFVTLINGVPRGWHTYALARISSGFHYVEAYDLPGFGHRFVDVWLSPRLEILRAAAHGREMGDSSGAEMHYSGRHATGWALVRRGTRTERVVIDTVLPPQAFDGLALMALIPALRLAPDTSIALTLFDTDEGSITTQTLRVGSVTPVTVPAGTFPTYRVDLSTTEAPVVLWYTTSTPYTLIRIGAPTAIYWDVLVSHRSEAIGR